MVWSGAMTRNSSELEEVIVNGPPAPLTKVSLLPEAAATYSM
jgi:hypothetical protein